MHKTTATVPGWMTAVPVMVAAGGALTRPG